MSAEITQEVIDKLTILYNHRLPEDAQNHFATRVADFQTALVTLAKEQQTKRAAILPFEQSLERSRIRLGDVEGRLRDVKRLKQPEHGSYIQAPKAENFARLRYKIGVAKKEGKLRGWRRLLSPFASESYPPLDLLEEEKSSLSLEVEEVERELKVKRGDIEKTAQKPLQEAEQRVNRAGKVLLEFGDKQAIGDPEIRQGYLTLLPGRLETVVGLYVRQNAASTEELERFWEFIGDQSEDVSTLARRHPWLKERTRVTPEQYSTLPPTIKAKWESYLRQVYRAQWQ